MYIFLDKSNASQHCRDWVSHPPWPGWTSPGRRRSSPLCYGPSGRSPTRRRSPRGRTRATQALGSTATGPASRTTCGATSSSAHKVHEHHWRDIGDQVQEEKLLSSTSVTNSVKINVREKVTRWCEKSPSPALAKATTRDLKNPRSETGNRQRHRPVTEGVRG